jgi:hypothetical protein
MQGPTPNMVGGQNQPQSSSETPPVHSVVPQTIPTKSSKLLKIGNFRLGKTIGEGYDLIMFFVD